MAYSFEEIMAFHPDNPDVYKEIKENLSALVPFVGAGLSRFAYPSWPDALSKLAEKVTNPRNRTPLDRLIKKDLLLDAAQRIEELRSPSNLARDLVHVFSPEKLEKKRTQLSKEAVRLLPLLFPGLVLTTNFDQVLETVYQNNDTPFQTVSHPGHTELLTQMLRQPHDHAVSGLYKFHGSIIGTMIEYEIIVFSRRQYDRDYGPASALVADLKKCFVHKMMFFLGCSLKQDRTMELLQSVLEPGMYHYAILNCAKKEDPDAKLLTLGNKHIRAILYEGDRHEAVRVILEHLLEESKPDDYQTLRHHRGELKQNLSDNRFAYNADIIPLSGRKNEMRLLQEFCTQDPAISFRWWAVTGPGGAGKSRLAHELKKLMEEKDWDVRYLKKEEDYEALGRGPLARKTLLIADYVQEHARELGKAMGRFCGKHRSLPLRILLVEREAAEPEKESAWVAQLYESVEDIQELKAACFTGRFLTLNPLDEASLLQIIENYIRYMQETEKGEIKIPPELQKKLLVKKLREIDPDLTRPLYALFLADAAMNGKNPEQWDRKQVLDYVIDREKKRLRLGLRQVMHSADQKLMNACLCLLCAATVWQDAEISVLQEVFPEAWESVEKRSECFSSPEELLYRVGLAHGKTMPALSPDLVGEYFVYDWLFDQKSDARSAFLSAEWRNTRPASIFFDRLFADYAHLLNSNPDQWEVLLADNLTLSKRNAMFYAMLLVNALGRCQHPIQVQRMINILEGLFFN